MPDPTVFAVPGRETPAPARPALRAPARAASAAAHAGHGQEAAAGEALTRWAVSVITAAIVVMTFAFSLGNVTTLCLHLGITVWIAWLVGPAVDLSVVGLLIGMRFLSMHGYTSAELAGLRRTVQFCGALTLALNTAGSIADRRYGTALVDAVGPVLLMIWAEIGPRLLRQIHAVRPAADSAGEPALEQKMTIHATPQPPVLPPLLLARTRELDIEHRAATGRPISRDNLRSQLRIGRDRASALVAAVRAESAAGDSGAMPLAA